jgi:glyoxylase-like metal-dependent hydrolase (beta-lactamase superfamily II)
VAEIDVLFQGTPGAITAHRAGGVIVDPGPASSAHTLLDRLGGLVPDAILLTHIHLDHAGATGLLVREWPGVEVWVHERGAPHLIDPSKLVASATRLYGDRMGPLWGEIVPVPEDRVRVLTGEGDEHDGWRWAYTPGHASHHVAYLHEDTGTAFTGDVAGVRIGDGPVLPPTPPPDIDVELWMKSMDVVEAWKPERLAVTHFGAHDPAGHLDALRERLRLWADRARELGAAGFEDWVREEMSGDESYLEAMPPETLYAGLERYWAKRISSDHV